ncbi:MAG: hypothetical protein R3C14_08350 [Caldilineaceae bacterium]
MQRLGKATWPTSVALILLFGWIYGRFVGQLGFAFDDYIELQASLAKPLGAVVVDSFTGALTWSGYRPLSYSIRALLAHLFGLEAVIGYHLFGLGLHLLNTLLVQIIATRLLRSYGWGGMAALLFLLLPAHNEAVLYISANANLIALCLGLLTLLLFAQARRYRALPWLVLTWFTYALAVLAYEVMLPLPLLLWLYDRLEKNVEQVESQQGASRLPPTTTGKTAQRFTAILLYGGLVITALLLIALRLWAMGGRLTPARADYAITTDWRRILQGYQVFWGQLFLLQTSPWPHLPLYVNVREWMSPLNPRALASMALTTLVSLLLLTNLRATSLSRRLRTLMGWWLWALVWLVIFSFPFVLLAGRFPENRYVYIPSVGFALLVVCTGAALHKGLQQRPRLATTILLLPLLLVSYYSFVTTSDVAEWERAAAHMRAFNNGVQQAVPTVSDQVRLWQVGVPGDVGSAYLFTTVASFRAAMQLYYNNPTLAVDMGDLRLSASLTQAPATAAQTLLVAYDQKAHRVYQVDKSLLCTSTTACQPYAMAQGTVAPAQTLYAQFYDERRPAEPGMALLFTAASESANEMTLASCWAFYNTDATQIDPRRFDNTLITATCQTLSDALRDHGLLAVAE